MEEVLDSLRQAAMLAELFGASIGQVPKGVCLTTMVPTAGVERTSVDLCASLADSGTSVVVDGSAKVLRALGSKSRANELVQFLKCCYEAEDEGVQVTTVAVLVLGLARVVDNWFAGSGKQVTVQTEDVAALMPRLPSKKRFQRVDPGTKLIERFLLEQISGFWCCVWISVVWEGVGRFSQSCR